MEQQIRRELSIFAPSIRIYPSYTNALHEATLHDQAETVVSLLEQGKHVDQVVNGYTALHLASFFNRLAIVDILISHGASTSIGRDGDGMTALHLAVTAGHSEVLMLLVKNMADASIKTSYGHTALHIAAMKHHDQIGHVRAEQATRPDSASSDTMVTFSHVAPCSDHGQVIKALLSAGAGLDARAHDGSTPLMVAAQYDHVAAANVLLDLGAYVDAQTKEGMTALGFAITCGSVSVLELLISKRAELKRTNSHGYSASRREIDGSHRNTALSLPKQPCPRHQNYGKHSMSALHMAVWENRYEVVQTLLDKGVDTETCDKNGDTALQYAVRTNQMNMVEILLRNGARINKTKDGTGETVLHWAVKNGSISMTRALLAHGSDPSSIDLSSLQAPKHNLEHEKHNANFETCKHLVHSALLTPSKIQLAEQLERPRTHEANHDKVDAHDATSILMAKRKPPRPVSNPIREMRHQAEVVSRIEDPQDIILHEGVRCKGPHCIFNSENLRGIRYVCAWCNDIDFCSACIGSIVDDHKDDHLMVKCYLPTEIGVAYEVDHSTKMTIMCLDAESIGNPQKISHIVYARTDRSALHQLQPSDPKTYSEWNIAVRFAYQPTVFAVYKPRFRRHNIVTLRASLKDVVPDDDALTHKTGKIKGMHAEHAQIGKGTSAKDFPTRTHHIDETHIAKAMVECLRTTNRHEGHDLHLWTNDGYAITRLVDLKPGAPNDKLEFELRTVDLRHRPKYEALSHTSKETSYKKCPTNLTSEGGEKPGTSLEDVLLKLRDPHQTRTLWIAQLCIDQENLEEREWHVSNTSHIYRLAQHVIVWTGNEDEHTSSVFELCRKIAHERWGSEITLEHGSKDVAWLATATSTDLTTLMALYEFFSHLIFSRIWCVHEIVVSQKVMVRRGKCEIEWRDLAAAAKHLSRPPWSTPYNTSSSAVRDAEDLEFDSVDSSRLEMWHLSSDRFQTIVEIDTLRFNFWSGSDITPSIQDLLFRTTKFASSEAKDKIYAVLGMRGREFLPGLRDNVRPDCRVSDAEVFTSVTRMFITQSKSMDVCSTMKSISVERTVGLPSWVPNYTNGVVNDTVSFASNLHHNASYSMPFVVAWPYERDRGILATYACRVGTVTGLSTYVKSKHEDLSTMMVEWSSLIDTISKHPTGESLHEVFVSTCSPEYAWLAFNRQIVKAREHSDAIKAIIAFSYGQYLRQHCSGPGQENVEILGSRTARAITKEVIDRNLRVHLECFDEGARLDIEDFDESNAPDDERFDHDTPGIFPPESSSERSSVRHENDSSLTEYQVPAKSVNKLVTALKTLSIQREVKDKTSPGPMETDPTEIKCRVTPDKAALALEHVARSALESIQQTCSDRKLFVTNTNFVGLGSPDVQNGDQVHILPGSRAPFILRKVTAATASANGVDPMIVSMVEKDGSRLYQMISESYVHGVMHGQVNYRLSLRHLDWNRIAIC